MAIRVDDEGSATAGVQQRRLDAAWRDPLEQSGELGREASLRVQSQPVPPAVLVEVGKLTLGVDLAHTLASVDEEHFPRGLDDDAGSRMRLGSGWERPTQTRHGQNTADQQATHRWTSSSLTSSLVSRVATPANRSDCQYAVAPSQRPL